MTELKAHAKFGASTAERWLNCPGSIEAAAKAPPQAESPYAAEGTLAHECFEYAVKDLILENRRQFLSRAKYPKEMVDHAIEAVGYVKTAFDELPGSLLFSERRVNASPFLGVPDQFGTLDISIVQEYGKLIVMDYKYGAGVAVDPVDSNGELNPQLAYYALAVSHEFNHNFNEVELVVIQPRAFHPSGDTFRSVTVSMDKLLAWGPKFKAGAERVLKSPEILNPGKWCKFCPAAIDCQGIKDKAFKDAQIVFADNVPAVIDLPKPEALPNLGKVLDACEMLEEWISKVRAHAFSALGKGIPVEGWKLVERRGTRKWLDVGKAAAEARKLYGAAAFTEPELKSPAQIEKFFGKNSKGWVADNTTTISSGLTLARDNDTRNKTDLISNVFSVLESEGE